MTVIVLIVSEKLGVRRKKLGNKNCNELMKVSANNENDKTNTLYSRAVILIGHGEKICEKNNL